MERKFSIDLLRIISCLAVIGVHVVSGPMTNYSGALDTRLVTILEKVHVLLNWAVPVFFMITGYCILNKQEYTYRHCFKHVRKFVLILATVGFVFALLEEVFNVRTFNVSVIAAAVRNVISGNLWDHMWYLYAIIGVYLVLPVLHLFMASTKNNRLILTGLLFFFAIVAPSIKPFIAIGVDIPLGGYLFYICFGGMVAKGDFSKSTSVLIEMAGLVSAIYILWDPVGGDFGYRSLAICLLACSIFIVFNLLNVKSSKFVAIASSCTLGIYLIHPLFLNVAIKVLKLDFLSHMPYLKLAGLYVVVSLIAVAVTYVIQRALAITSRFFAHKTTLNV